MRTALREPLRGLLGVGGGGGGSEGALARARACIAECLREVGGALAGACRAGVEDAVTKDALKALLDAGVGDEEVVAAVERLKGLYEGPGRVAGLP